MNRFYEPDLTVDVDSPFVRDAANKLVRRTYWLDMNDRNTRNGNGQRDWCPAIKRSEESASE
jgi:hypothetical protein